jgi:hypothetical protein
MKNHPANSLLCCCKQNFYLTKLLLLTLSLFYSIGGFAQGDCTSPQDLIDWHIDEIVHGSKLLSGCNTSYNCHGFVMHYFENNNTTSYDCGKSVGWGSPFITPAFVCPILTGSKQANDYQSSGKYVRVCDESNANIAFFNLSGANGDHSAVKQIVGTTIKYLSKYGHEGPLVGHNLTTSVYHINGWVTSTEFWAYIGGINGNQNIVGTSPVSFSVPNNPGVIYSWSITSGGSNIYISSANNQNSVTLTPLHSGSAILRLNISSACGAVKTQQIPLNIQTNICLEGTFGQSGGSGINLQTSNNVSIGGVSSSVTCPNATSFTWQRTSGSITSFSPSGPNVNFGMTSGGTISFLVTAKNGSTTLQTRNVAFYNFGSFSLFPNPSSGNFRIDLNKDLDFDLSIQSMDSPLKMEISKYKGGREINTSHLKPGDYVISIFYEGKVINQQRIVISK